MICMKFFRVFLMKAIADAGFLMPQVKTNHEFITDI